MTLEALQATVAEGLKRARELRPVWPDDPVDGAAIVGEEAGELIQAVLNARYHGASWFPAGNEALHVLIVATRFALETKLPLETR